MPFEPSDDVLCLKVKHEYDAVLPANRDVVTGEEARRVEPSRLRGDVERRFIILGK